MPLLYSIVGSADSCRIFGILTSVTLTTRNTILFVLLVLIIAIAFLVGFSTYLYRPEAVDLGELSSRLTTEQRFLLIRWDQYVVNVRQLLIVFAVSSMVSIVGTVLVLRYFRRTNAPEVFLFGLFLVSLSGDAFKLAIPLLLFLEQPPLYGAIVTRVVQFFHLFGVFCLFASTLFATGMDYQRLGNVVVVAFIVALAMTYTMPVDTHTLFPSLVFQMGDQITIQLLVVALALLSIVNIASSAVVHGSDGVAIYAGAVVLMFVGRELLFLLPTLLVSLVGGVLVIAGAVSYGAKKYIDYLWA